MLQVLLIAAFIGVAPSPEVSWRKPLAVYSSILAADLATTEWAEARGAQERNAPYRGGGKYALHLATASILTGADVWAQKRGKRWLVWTLRIGAGVAWGRAAWINARNARRARTGSP